MATALFQQVKPVLPVADVKKSILYYTEKLGFQLIFQDDQVDPKYAGVKRDGVELHLQRHDKADFSEVERAALRFAVDDADSLFTEYHDKGVFHSQTTLQDMSYGTREFAFYDTDGNGLFFVQNL